MANTTVRGAQTVHGTNPQFLIERVVRARIYDSMYWKQDCFALNATSLLDKAVDLEYVGGTYGMLRPSPFLCLVCKLLQIQPEREIVLEYLAASDLKYLRALAAMYIRMTFSSIDVYELLEPLLNDYHKLRYRDTAGNFSLTFIDQFVDQLLNEERVCDLILPRLTKRSVLEEHEGLRPRTSQLEDAMNLGVALGLDDEDTSDDNLKHQRKIRAQKQAHADATRNAQRSRFASILQAKNQDEDAYDSQQSESEEERMRARYMRSRSVSPDRALSIPPDRARSISPDRALSISPDRLGSVSPDRARCISPDRLGSISPDRARSISPDRLGSISPDRQGSLSPDRAQSISPDRAQSISPHI
ncbi:hypothetical protein MYAM1_002076 [Malassezia yamatoensis]|uniref:Pre-mRNA-splicing factor 38 n=1 Tax=Malassezia yamatoensis TaxID=253288 RepID=A0AAJ5YT72_9BASI|nr:hypothetical protein MYAM1_002076 [Malassezia yamatoensis]